ncbi:FAM172 family protein homolog CG10038 [Anopheles maculipalpis]|uniref:FAM172 family protein homolog CG10038 n=1 Tax=Anopheles maculipalpis TaxID=1496333 RepID=UPI0021597580|nr:FAM172 family protein homolog CG10038 [Anopheles maculipalpis]
MYPALYIIPLALGAFQLANQHAKLAAFGGGCGHTSGLLPWTTLAGLTTVRMAASEERTYPTTLEGFGYGFNEDGKLRQIDKETGKLTDRVFDYQVYTSLSENQAHYEALGDVITEYVYQRLVEQEGMKKLYVPDDVPPEEATFIFSTKEKLDKPKKLLVLIHGSGVVRAGQWARSLIINDCLDSGTQIPYINKGRELGYDVLLLNTNDNYRTVKGGARKPIRGSRNPTEHAVTVLEKYIRASNPESVAIVAHSYGGVVTVELAQRYPEFFRDKVFAVGFTDSVHASSLVPEVLKKIGRNWVTAKDPLDTPLTITKHDIPRHSAGHIKHEMTSYSCMSALFEFLESRYAEFRGRRTDTGSATESQSKKAKGDEL